MANFRQIRKALCNQMIALTDRWADEWQYESTAVLAHLSPYVKSFGGIPISVPRKSTLGIVFELEGRRGIAEILQHKDQLEFRVRKM
jgi:hypothetical protein